MNYTPTQAQKQRFSSLEDFLSQFEVRKKHSSGWNVRCPGHADNGPSLSVSEKNQKILLHCKGGCELSRVLESLNLKEKDLFLDSKPNPQKVDLNQLSIQKQIPQTFLEKVGVSLENPYSFKIKYFQEDGTEGRSRVRKGISAGESYWGPKGPEIIPYGLWRLDEARFAEELFLVEGESDCWTMWAHYDTFPALGIPGNTMTHTLKLEHLDEIKTLFIVKENDSGGGSIFVENVKKRLDEIAFEGEAKVFILPSRFKDPNDLHRKNPEGFRATFMESMEKSVPVNEWKDKKDPGQFRIKTMSMADLQKLEIQDASWVIPGILPEGLTLLAGRPKIGKSYLLLNICSAVTTGGVALGRYRVPKGSAIYLSFEDNNRRIKKRMSQVFPKNLWPAGFHFSTEAPKIDDGLLLALDELIEYHGDTKLVILDTLQKVMPSVKSNGDNYAEVYGYMGQLQKWSLEKGIALVLVHHLNKSAPDDIFDAVTGSTGYIAAADTLWALGSSKRGQGFMTFHGKGKDIDSFKVVLKNEKGVVNYVGDAEYEDLTKQRKEIVDIILSNEKLAAVDIAAGLRKDYNPILKLLTRMVDDGIIQKDENSNQYFL